MPRLVEGMCPQLTQAIVDKCKTTNIRTVTDFILIDPEELAKKIKAPYKDVLSIHRALISQFAGFPQNAVSLRYELLESISILDTGSKRLDMFLSGGIYTGEVTEIHGPPGAGKTQFCLSIVSNLIFETKNTVVYFDTSTNFDGKRLEQILKHKTNGDEAVINKLKSIKVKYVYDIYELFDCIDVLKAELNKKEDIFFQYLKILVIDSITPLISPCFGGKHMDGLGLMSNLVQQLHFLCVEYKLSILICNNTVQGNDVSSKPALGLNWKYAPSVSLCIDKLKETSIFKMKALKSCRNGLFEEATFHITAGGIVD